MSGFRLQGHARHAAEAIGFTFNGKRYHGRQGDTLASALLANGVVLVGRSFKYHRPRGIVGTGFAETNALVQLGHGGRSTPNVPATQVELVEGLEASSINCWPSVNFDIGAINGRFSRFLSAGFYYKSFIWPHWEFFEPFIRRAAGLGKAPVTADPDAYVAERADCDVLVVGGGVAGIAAAVVAAGSGKSVILLEAQDRLGGAASLKERVEGDGSVATWIAAQEAFLNQSGKCRILRRTAALGYYDHNLLSALEECSSGPVRQRFHKIRAERVVLAGGGMERPLLFSGNDVPGVMLAGAVREYAERHGVACGQAVVFVTDNDQAWEAALATARAGVPVRAIVDLRGNAPALADQARELAIDVWANQEIVRTLGGKSVKGLLIRDKASGAQIKLHCDCVGMSGGYAPAVQLVTQSGGSLSYHSGIASFIPATSRQVELSCGAARGLSGTADCIADGRAKGHWAATGEGQPAAPLPQEPAFHPEVPRRGAKAFVDFQTDVTTDDMRLAVQENYRSPEHVKRYTVWGMGVDQGKLSALNGVATLAALQGMEPGSVGTTKFRPPFAPLTLGALAAGHGLGNQYHSWQQLPAHDWHVVQGAEFEDYGCLRPTHYPLAGESRDEAAIREALHIRSGVGLMDSSSFGKFEISGPQAGEFLDRLSVGRPSTIPVGKIRYNLMCDDMGALLDDGVIARLAEDRFLMTASSGHAAYVLRWMEQWHQCELPMDLTIRDVSAYWAVLTVAGPRARLVLEQAECDIDLSAEAFPHNAIRCGILAGQPVRIQRVSFTGEVSFEIGIAADYAESLADYLMACGAEEGIIPFGLEALDILRLEKGYIYPGGDTDSRTLPGDMGWGRGIARKQGDFVGRRSIQHAASGKPGRDQLVGLQRRDGKECLPIGAHIIGGTPHPSQGIVTSSVFSPTLDQPLALALLRDGQSRMGEEVKVWSEGVEWSAVVSPICAFDPKGERLNG